MTVPPGPHAPAAPSCPTGTARGQPHHHGQQRRLARPEAQDARLRGRVLRRDPALSEVRQEVPAAPGGELLLLTRLHQHHGENARRPLGRHPVHGHQRPGHGEQDQPGPYRTGSRTAARHIHQHRARGRCLARRPAAAHPVPDLERIGGDRAGAGARRVQQLTVSCLQEDRVGGEVRQDAEHLRDPAAAEQRLRTPPVHVLGLPQQCVVTVDDLGVDLLGDRHERHLAVELYERQTGGPCGVHDRGGQPAEPWPELHHHGGDAPVGEPAYEGALLGGPGAEPQAGGEQQFTAFEQRGDVRDLARVHPAHRAAQPVRARHHLGESAAQPRQLKGALHGDAAWVLHWFGPRASVRVGRAVALTRKVPAG